MIGYTQFGQVGTKEREREKMEFLIWDFFLHHLKLELRHIDWVLGTSLAKKQPPKNQKHHLNVFFRLKIHKPYMYTR